MTPDLTQASASDLSALFASRETSPVEVLLAVQERAKTVNPKINALTMIDHAAALHAAEASEARWRAGAPLSPLDGVPVSIKELVRVRGWPHTMASKLSDKTPAQADSTVVARLREAGAVIFAQNASPEYGFKGVTDSPLNGVTKNPWDLSRTPGGSSGGAGAAVAAGLGPLAVGTDGGGSVRIPASFTGLVGHKATFGRIPAWPASMHGDLANTGPMTRTVRDCAMMMNAMARPDPLDPYSLPADGMDYVEALGTGPAGLKVGVIARFDDHFVDAQVTAHVASAARTFEALGCQVEQAVAPSQDADAGRIWSVHWLSALQRLLQLYPESRHEQFDQALLAQARTGASYSVSDIVNAQVARRDLSSAWNLFFTRYDLLICPTTAVLPFALGQNVPLGPDGGPNYNWACTVAFNLTRHPAISIPCGLSAEGLPIGLQIFAGHYRDAEILAAAEAFMQASPFTFHALPA